MEYFIFDYEWNDLENKFNTMRMTKDNSIDVFRCCHTFFIVKMVKIDL